MHNKVCKDFATSICNLPRNSAQANRAGIRACPHCRCPMAGNKVKSLNSHQSAAYLFFWSLSWNSASCCRLVLQFSFIHETIWKNQCIHLEPEICCTEYPLLLSHALCLSLCHFNMYLNIQNSWAHLPLSWHRHFSTGRHFYGIGQINIKVSGRRFSAALLPRLLGNCH